MVQILKAATVGKQLLDEGELALINRQTLRELGADEVFAFRLAACDNQVDRDHERFTSEALEGLASLYVGKSVLKDHHWTADNQTARVYDAHVESVGEVKRLILRCYMPRTERTAGTIAALESGILRECSVGCAMGRAVCNICGTDQTKTCCAHVPGHEYEGKACVVELDDPSDAYEVSLVAVPAQPEAGVVKSKRYGGEENPLSQPAADSSPKGGAKEAKSHEPASMMEKLAAMTRKDESK